MHLPVPFVLEGHLSFNDALLTVSERLIGRRAALAVGGMAQLYPGDTGEDIARFAGDRLAEWLALGAVRARFVCDRLGVVEMAPSWFSFARVRALGLHGRPRGGYRHGAGILRGRVVIEAQSLARVLDEVRARKAASQPPNAGPAASVTLLAPPAKGGRPRKYDYTWMALEVAAIVYEERRPPSSRLALIKTLQQRYHARFGDMPDVATLKPFVREVFQRLDLDQA